MSSTRCGSARSAPGRSGKQAERPYEGFTVWFTGLPSAGKSTLAQLLAPEFRQRGCRVELRDGNEVRTVLGAGLGFSRPDRGMNILRISYVSRLLSRNGVVAIAAAISAYRPARDRARTEIGRFVAIFVTCPVGVGISRDVKGLCRKALAGELPNFTGMSDPYEEPVHPEMVLETTRKPPEASIRRLLRRLEELELIAADGTGTRGWEGDLRDTALAAPDPNTR